MRTPFPLVLASTSRYRGELLARLGWAFEAIPPGVDEDRVKTQGLAPVDLALELSRLKANAVFVRKNNACVIGSDQVCALGEEVFGKPGDQDEAERQLRAMQGKTHELITAVTVITPQELTSFVDHTVLHMRPLSTAEIRSYLQQDRPFDCAGSYKLEAAGIKLFESIDSKDHSAITGLPLIELTNILLRIGYPL